MGNALNQKDLSDDCARNIVKAAMAGVEAI